MCIVNSYMYDGINLNPNTENNHGIDDGDDDDEGDCCFERWSVFLLKLFLTTHTLRQISELALKELLATIRCGPLMFAV